MARISPFLRDAMLCFGAMPVVPDFSLHRTKYPPKEPNLDRLEDASELIELGAESGVVEFNAPDSEQFVDLPPFGNEDEKGLEGKKYLWLIKSEDSKIILELHPAATPLIKRKRVSHTNLSGGKPACCGGELYFRAFDEIYVNGGSSRYHASSDAELKSAVRGLIDAGYKVSYAGWDDETNRERRVWRGEPIFYEKSEDVV